MPVRDTVLLRFSLWRLVRHGNTYNQDITPPILPFGRRISMLHEY